MQTCVSSFITSPLTCPGNRVILRADEALPPLLLPDCRQAHGLRVLRDGNLRLEAVAVLLGHLPVQGQARAGETDKEQGGTMSEIFFIADTHFGHRGIIQFSETAPHRPFATMEDHDAE